MIKDETKQTAKINEKSKAKVTSPIGKSDSSTMSKTASEFLAWLRDDDAVAEKNGAIDAKTATMSYTKGLFEIVKTAYKKPVACIATIAIGAVLGLYGTYVTLAAVMGFAIAAGAVGMLYSAYNLIIRSSSNNTKEAFEILGISTFVMAIGIYGLII